MVTHPIIDFQQREFIHLNIANYHETKLPICDTTKCLGSEYSYKMQLLLQTLYTRRRMRQCHGNSSDAFLVNLHGIQINDKPAGQDDVQSDQAVDSPVNPAKV